MPTNLLAHLDLSALSGDTPMTAKDNLDSTIERPESPVKKPQSPGKSKDASTDTKSIRISLPSTLVKRLALLRIAGVPRNTAIKDALEVYMADQEVQKMIVQVSRSTK